MSDEKVMELEESIDKEEEDTSSSSSNKTQTNDNSTDNNTDDSATDKKTQKRRKKNSAYSYLVEVVAVLLVFYVALSGLGGKLRFKKFAPFKVEAEGYVESIDRVMFTGSKAEALELGDLADSKYVTTFVYEVEGQVYESELYSKNKPKYKVGQTLTLSIDATDLDSIISVKNGGK